jgi:hypothetical protein
LRRFVVLAFPLAGCAIGDKADMPASYSKGLVTRNGIATMELEIDAATTSFMVTAEAVNLDALVAIETIHRPSGAKAFDWMDWYYERTFITASVWPMSTDVVLNWPIRAEDAPLTAGDWEVSFVAVDDSGRGLSDIELEAVVQTKADPDYSEGTVNVVIAYAGFVAPHPDVVDGVEQAVERWREVWSPHGLFINERYVLAEVSEHLPFVGEGDEIFDDLSSQIGEDEVLMLIGESIGGEQAYYGVSGNIPGSLVSTPRSAVQLSWLANTGLDGDFSSDDIRLFGETMAHELSHYMGLFHPVEITFDAWDAVNDTPLCGGQLDCESDLGDNLMYPYPVCTITECTPQEDITPVQAGISHRYTGTL